MYTTVNNDVTGEPISQSTMSCPYFESEQNVTLEVAILLEKAERQHSLGTLGINLDKYMDVSTVKSEFPFSEDKEQGNVWEGSFTKVLESARSSTEGVVSTRSSGRGEDVMFCKAIRDIIESVTREPVEYGYPNPTEKLLGESLRKYGSDMVAWISSFIQERKNSTIAADLLRCIGRLPFEETRTWAIPLARVALKDKSLEIRDAAVYILEWWDNSTSLELLSAHDEKEPWLREYIRRVISSLT